MKEYYKKMLNSAGIDASDEDIENICKIIEASEALGTGISIDSIISILGSEVPELEGLFDHARRMFDELIENNPALAIKLKVKG